MKITITLDCDNAAFCEDEETATQETARPEIIRLLKEQAEKFRFYPLDGLSASFAIKDINGNTCGHVWITPN